MKKVEILPPGLPRNENLMNGRERLLRPLNLRIDGEDVRIPAGFDHDGSSWPRWLPGPRQSRIHLAGIVHDYATRFATHGLDGRELGYMEINRLWYHVSLAGNHPDAKANRFWAWAGRAGLFAACWPTYLRYKNQRERGELDAESLRGGPQEGGPKGPDGDKGAEQGKVDLRRGPASGPGR